MTGWLIYDKKGYERNKWFAGELVKYLACRLIIAEELEFGIDGGCYFKYRGEAVTRPDYAVQRSIYPLLSMALEQSGVRVFNSVGVCEICNDKRRTHLLAAQLGIPTTKTAFSDKKFLSVPQTDMPFVLKSANGHGGSEVFMVNDKAELDTALNSIYSDGVLFQKPVSQLGVDKRVYVLGGSVLAAVERRAKEGFKSNFSLGGSAVLSSVTANEEQIISKMVNAIKPDFVGIDFIYDNGQSVLNEVEDIVGTRMLYELTDIDAAKRYAEYIIKQI